MPTEVKIGDELRILRRAFRMIATVTVVGTTLICIGPLLTPPKYTAKSQILIEPQGLMASQGSVIELPADEAAMQTEITALTSPDILQRVLDGLPSDPAFVASRALPVGSTDSFGADLWKRLSSWAPREWFTATGEPGPLNIRQLLRHLQVAQEKGSHVVGVSITSVSPMEAAAAANRLTRLYVESQEQQKRASTDRTLSWIATRLPELRDEVRRLDAEVQTYRINNNVGGNNPTAVNDQQINDLERQLGLAEVDLVTVRTRADIVRKLQDHGSSPMAIAPYVRSPALPKLHDRELALQETIAATESAYLSGSSSMNKLKAQLAEIRQQMQTEATRAAEDLTHELELAMARVVSIRHQLSLINKAGADVSLAELERAASSTHHLYENLLLRQEQLREQRESLSPGVRVLSLAQPPIHTSSINPFLFLPPAAILSFIIACIVTFAKAHLDRTLRSEREVRDVLGIPCMGLVPEIRRLRGSRPHQHMLAQQFSPYAEAIRSVVAGLQISLPSEGSKILLFSSSVPAEGKTTLAVSVAISLATLGRRVVLLDLDFRRPAVARELGGKASDRFLNLLYHHGPTSDCVESVPGLPLDFIVPPRSGGTDPMRLVASADMQALLQRLRGDYDYVIIDSAPLLAIAEARLLASMADKVVFVVNWGRTRRDVASNALGLLPHVVLGDDEAQSRVSAVVARVNLKKHARYSYGDSTECLVDYGSYFSESSKQLR
jgi:polysaccharide biosynthesis transport protein